MKGKIRGSSLIMAVAGLLLAAGSMTIFSACLPKADGSYMNCHNAQIAVAVCGLCLALLFLVGTFVRKKAVRLFFDAAALVLCAVTFMIPGTLVHICNLSNMHCRVRLRPFAKGAAIFIALLTIWDIYKLIRNKPEYGSGEE
ncbi:MAG: DUF4418 family protein [Lachnospiraceae bacterium]|nr:DUF4418 family protein [Lachnospiraceae bacterium]